MTERAKVPPWKGGEGQPSVGSNPTPSAIDGLGPFVLVRMAQLVDQRRKLFLTLRPISSSYADVAQLIDLTDSKSVGGDIVWVRIPLSAI